MGAWDTLKTRNLSSYVAEESRKSRKNLAQIAPVAYGAIGKPPQNTS
jgi:hypothetical protein